MPEHWEWGEGGTEGKRGEGTEDQIGRRGPESQGS